MNDRTLTGVIKGHQRDTCGLSSFEIRVNNLWIELKKIYQSFRFGPISCRHEVVGLFFCLFV